MRRPSVMELPFKPGLAPDAASVPGFLAWLSASLAGFEFASFSLGCAYASGPESEPTLAARRDFQAPLIRGLQEALSREFKPHDADLDLLLDFPHGRCVVRAAPVFVCGRYNKFSRLLAQTLHYCFKCKGRGRSRGGGGCGFCQGTGKLSKESVEELLAAVLVPAFRAQRGVFHGAGREDVDVLMLGAGRPFVFELAEPRARSADLAVLAAEVNARFADKVRVSGLVFCAKEKVALLKNAEHEKIYSVRVECTAPPDLGKLSALLGQKLVIQQRTPERVSKRRVDLVRGKHAFLEEITPLGGNAFSVRLRASSGLYIKEFVSGDSGRSNPSLSALLGVPCVCAQLDVLEILDAPAGLDSSSA